MSVGAIAPGVRGIVETEVTSALCTRRGEYEIFSTPNMVQLLERAAIEALAPFLGADRISVGTHVDVRHLAPTPRGMSARAEAVVREVEGARVLFDVAIFDGIEKVGEAVHERYVLDLERYMRRLEKKTLGGNTQ